EEPLAELRTGVKELDGLISKLAASPAGFGAFDASPARAVQGSASLQAQLATLAKTWANYKEALAPIIGFAGVPYTDSESAGVQLNAAGRKLTLEARKALIATRRETPVLVAATARVAASLEQDSARLSTYLRFLML